MYLLPGQILVVRMLWDQVPVELNKLKLRPEWVLTAEQRELAMARCHVAGQEFWSQATREHQYLTVSQDSKVQNQAEIDKGKWTLKFGT